MTVLLYVLATYVAVCWLWGLYLAVRVYTGRRVRHIMRSRAARARLLPKPISHDVNPGAVGSPSTAAIRKSKAA